MLAQTQENKKRRKRGQENNILDHRSLSSRTHDEGSLMEMADCDTVYSSMFIMQCSNHLNEFVNTVLHSAVRHCHFFRVNDI